MHFKLTFRTDRIARFSSTGKKIFNKVVADKDVTSESVHESLLSCNYDYQIESKLHKSGTVFGMNALNKSVCLSKSIFFCNRFHTQINVNY